MSAFPNVINDAVVGQQVVANASFVIAPNTDTTGLLARYSIVDADDSVWTTGIATNVVVSPLGSRTKVNASASVDIPYTLPVEYYGTKYQLAWTLENQEGQIVSSFIESFNVKPVMQGGVFGVPDIVEAATNKTLLQAVLPSNDQVEVLVFKGNSCLNNGQPVLLQPGDKVFNGTQYSGSFNHSELKSAGVPAGLPTTVAGINTPPASVLAMMAASRGLTVDVNAITASNESLTPSLEPYNLWWQYKDEDSGEVVVEDSYLYHVTPMILQAGRELQQLVNRANNVGRLPELTIDLNVIIQFLKQGGDYFNSVGMPTFFDFTSANGPFRQFWVQCAAVRLLRSQYLLEAERSMVMQGQSVTLDLDITQYYETAAADAQAFIDQYLPEFKQNITRKGLLTGDGDYGNGGIISRNVGAMGIQLSAVTNLFFGWRNNYSRRGLF